MTRIRFGRYDGVHQPTELVAGAELVGAARRAGQRAAGIIGRQLRERPAVAEVLGPAPTRLLLTAGVLLDLLVGDLVRRRGLSPACPAAGTDWVLPDAPLRTGVRCVYHPPSETGAAVLWLADAAELPLPRPGDLAALAETPARAGQAGAARLLRLRYTGWTGSEGVVALPPDSGRRQVLGELADTLVAAVHQPLYAELGLAASDQRRHLANRLVLDAAVGDLLAAGHLRADRSAARRLLWTGPNWALAADASPVAEREAR